MKIIPHQPYETNSKAEYRVFDKLKESFVNSNEYIAFHSLNLTRHQEKRFGEADFVIICKYGLFVFEVKGGGISCSDGRWHTVNRDGEKHQIQNPFTQAETALHAIHKNIKESQEFNNLNIPIGYGVIFPDIQWVEKSAEWDKLTICDSSKFKNFEYFLSIFFKYWHTKKANIGTLSPKIIKEIASYLRPNFEIIETLSNALDGSKKMAVTLTKEQYKYLDIVASNKRVLCSGGAGTGKTFLAAELARRIARKDKKVIVICKSKWLRQYLNSKIINEFVTIATISSVKMDMRRDGIQQYDVLIIDEGQDIFNIDDIDLLDGILASKIAKGEWYIFHDSNNQVLDKMDGEVLDLLQSYNPANVPLTINCRNTSPILQYIENLLAVDMGKKETENGPKVIEIFDNQEKGVRLEKALKNLLKNGVDRSNITILSPEKYADSIVCSLSQKRQKEITLLDDYSIRTFPAKNISYARIRDFKGLENEVIVLVDISKESIDDSLYYVAMSRAKGLLVLIWDC